jgi:predicted nucleic-acid-binding protein
LIGIDTSVLVRHFTQDDAEQAAVAGRFLLRDLSNARPGHISLVALAEMCWVLRSRYKTARDEIITIIESLLTSPNLCVQDENAVWAALDECESGKVSVGDALIATVDRLHGCSHTVSFDSKACGISGMMLLR